MTTRAQLSQAQTLNAELDQAQTALNALTAAGAYDNAFLELHIAGNAGFRLQVNPSVAAVTNLLNNRITALTNALASLGVTG